MQDEVRYNMAFEAAARAELEEDDVVLWRDLSRYSDYIGEGPERPRSRRNDTDGETEEYDFDYPKFLLYINAIRKKLLSRALQGFPRLSSAVLMDYCSAVVEGLIDGVLEPESRRPGLFHRPMQNNEGRDFEMPMYFMGAHCRERIKDVAVGPHLVGNSAAY